MNLLLVDCPFVQILGIRFFDGPVEQAVATISVHGGLLVAPAAPPLTRLRHDAEYRRALMSADIVIADSGAMTLFWKMRSGQRVQRISGLKYLKCLVARFSEKPKERVLWILPNEPARRKAIEWLQSRGMSAEANDFYVAPQYETPVRDELLRDKIDKNVPNHVVIAIGGGVQEKLGLFLKEHAQARPAIHCIGAALGFLTGDQVAIPDWADRFYLGWLLRLQSQPRVFVPRLSRALELPWLIWKYRENLPPLRSR